MLRNNIRWLTTWSMGKLITIKIRLSSSSLWKTNRSWKSLKIVNYFFRNLLSTVLIWCPKLKGWVEESIKLTLTALMNYSTTAFSIGQVKTTNPFDHLHLLNLYPCLYVPLYKTFHKIDQMISRCLWILI